MTKSPISTPRSAFKKPGRFDAEERGKLLLEAVAKLFLEHGYAETSLNDVIRVAGGSKTTITEQFGNKAGLFAAVIEATATNFAETLTVDPAALPKETLQRFGEAILRFYLSRGALLTYRAIVPPGRNIPTWRARSIFADTNMSWPRSPSSSVFGGSMT